MGKEGGLDVAKTIEPFGIAITIWLWSNQVLRSCNGLMGFAQSLSGPH